MAEGRSERMTGSGIATRAARATPQDPLAAELARVGDPSVPTQLLGRLAAGGRLLGLVEAVEPVAPGEWSVRLRLGGEVVQVRSRVPIEVGSVRAFRAPDARWPRFWTVVPRGSESTRETRPAEAGPGMRLGRALLARRTEVGTVGSSTRPAADLVPFEGATAGARESWPSRVLVLGPRLLSEAVRAAFSVVADHALLRALVEEVAGDPRSTSWMAAAVEVESGSDRGATPARDALRAFGTGIVEVGRAVDRGSALLPIPIPFDRGHGLEEFRCYVATDDGASGARPREASGEGFLVVLLLELSELGALRIDVRSAPGRFFVRFATAIEAVRSLLDARLESIRGELAAGLGESGLQAVIEVAVASASESTSLLRELDVVDRVVRGAEGLDVHA